MEAYVSKRRPSQVEANERTRSGSMKAFWAFDKTAVADGVTTLGAGDAVTHALGVQAIEGGSQCRLNLKQL